MSDQPPRPAPEQRGEAPGTMDDLVEAFAVALVAHFRGRQVDTQASSDAQSSTTTTKKAA